MATKKVTINDVAAAAGVSRQTVTRAMNHMSRISPETRKRVLEISDQLGYRPSRFASNLARQKHHALGLVVATLRNPYYSDLAADVIDTTAERGWEAMVATTEHVNEVDVVERLSHHVDVIAGYFSSGDEAAIAHAAGGLPVISIERPMSAPGLHAVELDFRTGIGELVAELQGRGTRRIAMIDLVTAGRAYAPSHRYRLVEEIVGAELVAASATEALQSSSEALQQILESHPEVDTVIAFNDLTAMGVLLGAHSRGLSVPEDLKVVGIDGLSLGDGMYPALSTLKIDGREIADAILDLAETAPNSQSSSRIVVPRPLWRQSA